MSDTEKIYFFTFIAYLDNLEWQYLTYKYEK